MRSILIVTVFTLAPASAFAVHPLTTDDAGTQGAGAVEVELSTTAVGTLDGDTSALTPAVGLAVGLADPIDVGLVFGYDLEHARGLGWTAGPHGPAAFVKWRAVDFDEGRALGLRLDYEPPHELGHDASQHAALTAIASTTTGAAELHLNARGELTRSAQDGAAWTIAASAMTLFPVSGDVLAGGELLASHAPGAGSTGVEGLAALVWETGERTRLSLGTGLSWATEDAWGFVTTVGFTLAAGPE